MPTPTNYTPAYVDLSEALARATGRRLLVEVFLPPPNAQGVIRTDPNQRDYPVTGRVTSAGPDCTSVSEGDLVVLGGANVGFYATADGRRALVDENAVVMVVEAPVVPVTDDDLAASSAVSTLVTLDQIN